MKLRRRGVYHLPPRKPLVFYLDLLYGISCTHEFHSVIELHSAGVFEDSKDFQFFCYEAGQFAPASCAQTLSRLRQLLELSGLTPAESNAYTLHSMKSTFLSWMAQLEIPLTSHF